MGRLGRSCCNFDAAWNHSNRPCSFPIQYRHARICAGEHGRHHVRTLLLGFGILCRCALFQANGTILRTRYFCLLSRRLSSSKGEVPSICRHCAHHDVCILNMFCTYGRRRSLRSIPQHQPAAIYLQETGQSSIWFAVASYRRRFPVLSSHTSAIPNYPPSLPLRPRHLRRQSRKRVGRDPHSPQASPISYSPTSKNLAFEHHHRHPPGLHDNLAPPTSRTRPLGTRKLRLGFLPLQLPGPRKERPASPPTNDDPPSQRRWPRRGTTSMDRLRQHLRRMDALSPSQTRRASRPLLRAHPSLGFASLPAPHKSITLRSILQKWTHYRNEAPPLDLLLHHDLLAHPRCLSPSSGEQTRSMACPQHSDGRDRVRGVLPMVYLAAHPAKRDHGSIPGISERAGREERGGESEGVAVDLGVSCGVEA